MPLKGASRFYGSIVMVSGLKGDDDPFLLEGDANEDCKPFVLPDTKPKMKDTGDPILPSPSSVTLPQVKTEKDDFIELCTPGSSAAPFLHHGVHKSHAVDYLRL
ncbi:hypothetical protein A6R68_24122, partial [Neotoma lepida]